MAQDVDAVLTDEVRAWIGRSSDTREFPEPISASDVRRYLDATGDRNPLWHDDAYAQAAGYRGALGRRLPRPSRAPNNMRIGCMSGSGGSSGDTPHIRRAGAQAAEVDCLVSGTDLRSYISPRFRRTVSLIQFWILRVSRRLLLLCRRQSWPPSLTLATRTGSVGTSGLAFKKMPPPESPEHT